MKIRKFGAGNYKSIFKLDQFDLTDGFNIVTGQNAAGKTALLETMSLQFSPKPHRSEKTIPNKGDITDNVSVAHVQLEVANSELKRILRNTRQNIALPVPDPTSPLAIKLGINN
jgi:AAA15 family ATPase/GTPase